MKSEREINHSHDGRDVDNRPLQEQCAYLADRVTVLAEERKALLDRVKELEGHLEIRTQKVLELEQQIQRMSRE